MKELVVDPVMTRAVTLQAGPCESLIGHSHQYHHTTLVRLGEVDVSLLADADYDKRPVTPEDILETYELRPVPVSPDYDRLYCCSDLWLRRVNLLPAAKQTISFERRTALFMLSGSLEMDYSYTYDGVRHNGHMSALAGEEIPIIGNSQISVVSDKLSQFMLVWPRLPTEEAPETTQYGTDFCFVAEKRQHLVKSRVSPSIYSCVFPHRTYEGVVVETYDSSMRNQKAYC